VPTPTELVSVERRLLHQTSRAARSPPPPNLSRWSEGLGTRRGRGKSLSCAETFAPPRQARWGRRDRGRPAGAEAPAPPRQARWGRREGDHPCGAEAVAPPGRARRGRGAGAASQVRGV